MVKRWAVGAAMLGTVLLGGVAMDGQSPGPLTLALTGDSIITQRLSPFKEPEFTGLMDMIRGADAAFTNLETRLADNGEIPRVDVA